MIVERFEAPAPVELPRFCARAGDRLRAGARALTFYSGSAPGADRVALTLILAGPDGLELLRTEVDRAQGFHALTPDFPPLHIFEREIAERDAVPIHGHPWLKPVRFSGARQGELAAYPFYKVEGKEVHEVAVGPVHAGVIEPGHFRFMCLGETVHHLEIQLGYQHRGVEALLAAKDPRRAVPLVETVAGDSSIAHAWAFCAALEALAGANVDPCVALSRGIALELERVAMHLASLSGLATDIAFLPGGTAYGRLRTTAINTTMALCGSRFGRSWLRPGGAMAAMDAARAARVRANLDLLERDLAQVNAHFLGARSVRHRLQGVGVLTREQAQDLGLVGLAARACGVELDVRHGSSLAPYATAPVDRVTEARGDGWARARVRIREIDASLRWLNAAVERAGELAPTHAELPALAPSTLAVAVVEGFRGEVVYALETDARGQVRQVRVQDPSLRNWFGLALALRQNEISDFPLCNKSFDLSYCGNDL